MMNEKSANSTRSIAGLMARLNDADIAGSNCQKMLDSNPYQNHRIRTV
jgi:hypothetical protein